MPTAVGPDIKGEENLVFGYDLGDIKNSYKGPPTQNYAHQNVANCSTTSGWDGTSVHTQFGLSRTLGVLKDGRTTFHLTYTPNASAGDCYHTFRLKNTNGTNVVTDGGEVFYLTFEWKSEGANYLVEGSDRWDLSTFYGNGWKTGTHMSAQDLGTIAIGNGWYRRTVKYTAAAVAGQTPLMRFSSGYKRTQGGNYQLWVANIAMTSNHPPLNWLPGQTIRSATEGLKDLTGNSTIDLTNVSFDSDAQMTFDGSNDRVLVPEANVPNFTQTDSFTVETVGSYQTQSSSGMVALVERYTWSDANKGGYSLRLKNYSTNYPEFYVGSNNSHAGASATSVSIVQGQKYHIVGTFDTGNIKIYVNGELKGTATTSASYPLKSQAGKELAIGVRGDTQDQYSEQDIDVVKLYTRELTASEIKSNYNAIKGRFNI